MRAAFVSANCGALPSYISRSLASSQNDLSKYLSGEVFRGFSTHAIVAFRSLSKELLGTRPSSRHTRLFVATWICSSLEISADTVLRAASPRKRNIGSRTKNIARSATSAFVIVWSGCCIQASLNRIASISAIGSAPWDSTMKPRARSCLISSLTFDSRSVLAACGTSFCPSLVK